MSSLVTTAAARLLIVDDDPVVRTLIARWLTNQGYNCVTASRAEEAWEHLSTSHVDLVTLDITMPGESGLTLLDRIRARSPDTAAIMLTAESDLSKAIRALTAGAAGYLVKPIVREELLVQVQNALERRRLVIAEREHTRQLENKVREQTQLIRLAHEETIHRLVTASMYRDEETGAHIRRVGHCSAVIADALGWSWNEVENIRMAAPMHDIGKIGIPDSILQKAGPLTPAEFEVMKGHTVIGAQMLAGSDSAVLELGRIIALSHHERWDGAGYPNHLAGTAIPESARIVAIVDVYDALTHDRVYRKALPVSEALNVLEKGRGTHFDPELLELFFTLTSEMEQISRLTPDDATQLIEPQRLAFDTLAAELMLQRA